MIHNDQAHRAAPLPPTTPRGERCGHYPMCISVCEYGLCENEDPTYNNPNHCKYDTRASPNQVNTVISELEKGIKLWSENLQPKDDYENGVIAGLKEAISLLKAGKI